MNPFIQYGEGGGGGGGLYPGELISRLISLLKDSWIYIWGASNQGGRG